MEDEIDYKNYVHFPNTSKKIATMAPRIQTATCQNGACFKKSVINRRLFKILSYFNILIFLSKDTTYNRFIVCSSQFLEDLVEETQRAPCKPDDAVRARLRSGSSAGSLHVLGVLGSG